MKDIQFINRDIGWSVGNYGKILHTTSGGNDWHSQPSYVSTQLNALCFVNDSTGWVAGDGGLVISTHNSGHTWDQLPSGTNADINSVHFANTFKGWYCGENGVIKVTSDSGTSWTSQTSGTTSDLNNVFFLDENNGWIAGNAFILHTINGGSTWVRQTTGIETTARSFRAVYFVDLNNGWAVGEGYVDPPGPGDISVGVIYSTKNGGNTWHSAFSFKGEISPFNDVFFINLNEGWAVGSQYYASVNYLPPMILHTKDGGVSWSLQRDFLPSGTLESVHFSDSVGWAVGGSGNRGLMFNTKDFGGKGYCRLHP